MKKFLSSAIVALQLAAFTYAQSEYAQFESNRRLQYGSGL